MTTHPLDSLTADEINKAVDLYRAHDESDENTLFINVTLVEPSKEFVRSYKEGEEFDRSEKIVQIVNFFQQRDFDTSTSQNEFYNRLNKYIAIADQQYSTRSFLGSKTDRGRVLIVYGRPNDIESYNANEERLSNEIWEYEDSDNGYLFIFINKEEGAGMFEQIHSNHPNEFRNYRWKDMIVRGTTNLIDF